MRTALRFWIVTCTYWQNTTEGVYKAEVIGLFRTESQAYLLAGFLSETSENRTVTVWEHDDRNTQRMIYQWAGECMGQETLAESDREWESINAQEIAIQYFLYATLPNDRYGIRSYPDKQTRIPREISDRLHLDARTTVESAKHAGDGHVPEARSEPHESSTVRA